MKAIWRKQISVEEMHARDREEDKIHYESSYRSCMTRKPPGLPSSTDHMMRSTSIESSLHQKREIDSRET